MSCFISSFNAPLLYNSPFALYDIAKMDDWIVFS